MTQGSNNKMFIAAKLEMYQEKTLAFQILLQQEATKNSLK